MKIVFAYCAVVTLACCAPTAAAPARTGTGSPFDGFILRPPASIPHARATRVDATPLPRPKPVSTPRTIPGATPTGPLVFPPVTPLE
ncbi:MAG TPA: hypothetical protein VGX95_13655 [Xanthobacteraceae bacterium]|jgi:hypothetical protein|nr:hypothetical protein [Xanthobacteraceae bacterium]